MTKEESLSEYIWSKDTPLVHWKTKEKIRKTIKLEEKLLWDLQKGKINFADFLEKREDLLGEKLCQK